MPGLPPGAPARARASSHPHPLPQSLQAPAGRTVPPAVARASPPRSPAWLALAAGAVLLAWALAAQAASVGLAWDPVPSTALRGYMVYYVPAGSGTLTQPVQSPAVRLDVGNRTTHTLSNLAAGTTYQIAVTAYDASGAESAFSNVVSYTTPAASVPPVARFSASTTSGTAPLALNFVDESTGTISGYAWTFGDGTTSTARNPAKVYSSPGTYTVSLTVAGSAGSNTLTKSGYVTVSAPPPSGGSDGTVLLSQDFAGTSLAGWRVQDDGLSYQRSRWLVSGGELAQLNETYGGSTATADLAKPGTYLLYEGGATWADYRLRFRMRGADDDAMGVMFRVRDGSNYYRFSWDKQRAYRRLVKNVGGTFTLLASDSVPYQQNRNYDVEVVVQGSTIEVWIDGARIFRVTDGAHPRGSIAFYTWAQSGAYFDNLVVQ
ncbi:MAG: hypothetical protein BroJett026_07000 [Betaproteobacteria bacterium]|nr:MAG: hypothetical protein BroJett026_07000 [Betaproteobacteria bacterium]